MKYIIFSVVITLVIVCLAGKVYAQKEYEFHNTKKLPATSVKFQGRTGTCWIYGTLSFLESELIRKNNGKHNLSEMFVVWHNYSRRVRDYVKFHGNQKFSGGAEGWDVFNVIKNNGIVPQKTFKGKIFETYYHDHIELDAVLQSFADTITALDKLTPAWKTAFDNVLNAYLGNPPDKFEYRGKNYTPERFAKEMEINPDNYITIGSYTHHPFYSKFLFEGPDNWSYGKIYNVPLDELMQTMHHAIKTGYTFSWVSDVSEKGFSHSKGLAVVPDVDLSDHPDKSVQRWTKMTKKERKEYFYSFTGPVPEQIITQKKRQKAFNNYSTTEDHLMHIIGKTEDKHGTDYFIVKNSWGRTNPYGGYIYASEPFVKYKTLSISLHKDAVPPEIFQKLTTN